MERKSWIRRVEERFPDYDITHAPLEKRRPWHAFTVLWMAWCCILAPTLAGAAIVMGLSIPDAITAIIIGSVIIACVSVGVGLVGKRMGLGTGMLSRYAFGIRGAILPVFLAAFVMFCWCSLDQWMTGTITMGLIGATWGWFVGPVILVIIAIGAVITGIRGPVWIAYCSVPLMMAMYITVIVVCIIQGGGWGQIMAWEPIKPVSLVFGIMLALASWINGSVLSSDLVRMARTNAGVFAGPPAGLIIANGMNLFLGAIGFVALQAFGLAELGLAFVGAMSAFVIICAFIMLLNSNPETVYSSSLGFASIFQIQKHRIAIGVGCGAICLAAIIQWVTGGLAFVLGYLPLVAATMAPIAGIIMADYWVVNKGKWPDLSQVTRNVSWIAVIAWVVGTGINIWTARVCEANPLIGIQYGIPGLNGLIAAFIVHWALMAIFRPRIFAPASGTAKSSSSDK